MAKLVIAVAAGFLVGLVAAIVVPRGPALDVPTVETAAKLSAPNAEQPATATPRTLAQVTRLASDFEQTAALYQMLRRADTATLDRLLAEADTLERPRDARETKSVILARYAEIDPAAAVNAAMATTGSDDALVRAAFAAWGEYDPAAALDHARTLPELQKRYAAMAVLGTADALDPDEKREIAESFGILPAFARMQAQESALDDPVAAWSEAVATHGSQPDAAGREALWRIAQRWADSDPRAAVAAVAQLPHSTQRRSWLSTLIKHWARLDLAAATAWAEALPGTPERSGLLADAAAVIAEDTPVDAIAFAETLTGNARQRAIRAALNAWAEQDPSAAMAALDELGDRTAHVRWQREIVSEWARQDVDAAWEWALSQPPSRVRSNLLSIPLGSIAQTDPLEAMALADSLRGRERSEAMMMALGTWASNDARAAANWTARADDVEPGERDGYLRNVLGVWAREDPLAALAWVEASDLSSGPAVSAVAGQYARRSPRQAMNWVLSQPVGIQRQAIAGVVRAWARDAPQAAARAVGRIRNDEVRAAGQETLASTWAETDPTRALRWVATVSDAATRTELSTRVLRRWVNYDAAAAASHVRRERDARQRDAMAWTLIRSTSVAYSDPDVAEELYEAIDDPEVRRQAASFLSGIFEHRDPERAERYRASGASVRS
ncbi:MAG: hypothetical protein OXG82_00835 [Gammaproteobacteria bacterium]|nr:hypothetical protein [Gammaproteobacteria bacterium]